MHASAGVRDAILHARDRRLLIAHVNHASIP
jgi:hypothetical protein